MPNLNQHYFDLVYKIIVQRKRWPTKANFFYLTLMELLEIDLQIDLPSLIIKYTHAQGHEQDENRHVFPYVL